jgi:hypothetical protein
MPRQLDINDIGTSSIAAPRTVLPLFGPDASSTLALLEDGPVIRMVREERHGGARRVALTLPVASIVAAIAVPPVPTANTAYRLYHSVQLGATTPTLCVVDNAPTLGDTKGQTASGIRPSDVLVELVAFRQRVAESQTDLPPDAMEVLTRNLWDLYE